MVVFLIVNSCSFADTDAMLMTDDDACLRPGRGKSSEARSPGRSFRFQFLTCPQSKRLFPGCILSYRPYNCLFNGKAPLSFMIFQQFFVCQLQHPDAQGQDSAAVVAFGVSTNPRHSAAGGHLWRWPPAALRLNRR
jgi:hypothetical protein